MSLQSCSDWLSLQPIDRQTEEQLFATKGGFYTALNGVYNNIASNDLYGRRLSWEMIDIIALRYTVNFNNLIGTNFAAFNYSDSEVEKALEAVWSKAYNTILNINVIIDNCEKANGPLLTIKDYSLIKGEALAARAFLHFDMLRCFGPIYVKNATAISIPYNEFSTATTLPMLPANEIIEKLLIDLDLALNLLSQHDPIVTDGVMNTPRTETEKYEDIYRYRQLRFNYYSTLLLKARVLHYSGNRQDALLTAKLLIGDPNVAKYFPFVDPSKLLGNSSTPDRTFSSEMLFGIYNQNRGLIFRNNFSPEGTTNNLLQPRTNFVVSNLFNNETQDYRYQSQWASSNAIGNTNPMFVKYMDIADKEIFYANVFPLIRLSEAYYIAAECETDLSEAYNHLNIMRERRGVPQLPVTSSADLHSKLNNEYNREFAGEGQLFFYYKRRNITMPNTQNGYNTSSYGLTDARGVFPLPKNEISVR